MAQLKERSFNVFLSSAPLLPELLEHIDVGTKWYFLGTLLYVEHRRLDGIEQLQGHDDTSKTLKMFQHWLTTTPTASRKQVLEALRKRVVNEHVVADKYEKHLKELHDTTYTPPSTEAVSIFQRNIQSLNKALVSPVQVSQLLYCKRCISEATLDEMERIDQRRSLDDKKTTLLTGMQETVSSDYRKLKDIATVLSDVEQTRDIGNEIMTKYEETIHQGDDSTVVQPQEVVGGNEDCASDILRNNYSALSQSITEPVRVAKLLYKEVISDEALSCVMSTRGSVSVSRAVLLKAVRDAVHSNYKHLELFVTVLRKFSETAHIGDTIFKEYKALFPEGKMISELHCHLKVLDQSSSEEEFSSASSVSVGGPVYFPLNKDPEFSSLRCKFGSAFYAARCAIEKKNINPGQMRMLLSDCFPHKQEFSNEYLETTNDILDVVKMNCNLIDINCLEVIVSHFNVSEAFDPLEAYKAEVEEFCKVLRDELNESLEVVRSPRPLSCETIVLVLDQTPLTCTVGDIKDLVRKASGAHIADVRILSISDSHSIAITCFVPMSLTGYFIATVLQNIKHFQSKGLKELILDNTIIWELNNDKQKSSTENDAKTKSRELLESQLAYPKIEEVKIEEDKLIEDKSSDTIEELKKKLQTQYRISRMKGLEIEDLKAKIREKEEQFLNTEKELASLKELSETRLQEIEQLKLKLEDNNRLQVQVEETTEKIKDKSSDDDTSSNKDIIIKPEDKLQIQEGGEVTWSQDGVQLIKQATPNQSSQTPVPPVQQSYFRQAEYLLGEHVEPMEEEGQPDEQMDTGAAVTGGPRSLLEQLEDENLTLKDIAVQQLKLIQDLHEEKEQLKKKPTSNSKSSSNNTSSNREGLTCYKMDKKPHGIAIVIGNEVFMKNKKRPKLVLGERRGCLSDVYNFKSCFEALHYQVRAYENCFAGEIIKIVDGVSSEDHSNYDSFVFCISTHGEDNNYIFSSDSERINVYDLVAQIQACPTLQNKPKLFFIEACRATHMDVPAVSGDSPETVPPVVNKDADVAIFWATTRSQSSYRSPRDGSWFVASIHKVFTAEAHRLDLVNMMYKVTHIVTEMERRESSSGETVRQCVETSLQMRGAVYFI